MFPTETNPTANKEAVLGILIFVQREKEDEEESQETKALKKDPTLPAKLHGNEPSKGAKIDAQIQAEEEEELGRKGKA